MSEEGTHTPVKATFWPWLEPILRHESFKSLKLFKLFPPRTSTAVERSQSASRQGQPVERGGKTGLKLRGRRCSSRQEAALMGLTLPRRSVCIGDGSPGGVGVLRAEGRSEGVDRRHRARVDLRLVCGSGFRVQGMRFQGSGFRVQGSGYGISGVQGSRNGFRIQGSGHGISQTTNPVPYPRFGKCHAQTMPALFPNRISSACESIRSRRSPNSSPVWTPDVYGPTS